MIDDSNLVRLINERFDDLNSRIDDLKRDMVARAQNHEQEDKDRFTQIQAEIEPLKKAKWSNAGAAGSSAAVITVLAEALRQYLAK